MYIFMKLPGGVRTTDPVFQDAEGRVAEACRCNWIWKFAFGLMIFSFVGIVIQTSLLVWSGLAGKKIRVLELVMDAVIGVTVVGAGSMLLTWARLGRKSPDCDNLFIEHVSTWDDVNRSLCKELQDTQFAVTATENAGVSFFKNNLIILWVF